MADQSTHTLDPSDAGWVIHIDKRSAWTQRVVVTAGDQKVTYTHDADAGNRVSGGEDFAFDGEIRVSSSHQEPGDDTWYANTLVASKDVHEGKKHYSEWEDGGGGKSDVRVYFKEKA